MITHFAGVQLNTVSIQGVKQFYHDKLRFPIVYKSETEIRFQPAEHITLSFVEAYEPIAPAHLAFEVPYSQFDPIVDYMREAGIPFLHWPDGREVDEFEPGGKNIYFRDGDGNLLELISHSYIQEGVVSPYGPLNVLYLREIGFPVADAPAFREWLKRTLRLKTIEESDTFNFVIGGTAHAIVVSDRRKWIPISMHALPPKMKVTFGVSEAAFIEQMLSSLKEEELYYEIDGELHFIKNGYSFSLKVTTFDKEIPALLHLP